jgi:multidrug efflux pump subunit AcrB
MWIVRIALQRPYTFIVMALTILLATPYMLLTMAVDILPDINIPVISVIWNYTGFSAQEMGNRITGPAERILTTQSTTSSTSNPNRTTACRSSRSSSSPARTSARPSRRRWRASR